MGFFVRKLLDEGDKVSGLRGDVSSDFMRKVRDAVKDGEAYKIVVSSLCELLLCRITNGGICSRSAERSIPLFNLLGVEN